MLLGVAAAVVGDEVVPGDVEIGEGSILRVGVAGGQGEGLAVPGFIDVHIHGFSGVDFTSADGDAYREATRALTRTGVTAFRPSLISLPVEETLEAVRRHAKVESDGARVLGMHLEGPFLSPAHPGAHAPDCLIAPNIELAMQLVDAGRVGHMTVAPELPGALDLIRQLVAAGVTVSLGHSDATSEQAHRGFDAGARALTHVFNGSRKFHHRDPGIVGAALARNDVYVEAILDGVHLSDEAALLAMKGAGSRLLAVTDGMAAAGLGDGSYMLGNRQVEVRSGEARLADGTIASSLLTMDAAFRKLIDLGASIPAAARATSRAAAELIGQPELGLLDPGSLADLVVLDDDFQVMRTLVGGVEVFPG